MNLNEDYSDMLRAFSDEKVDYLLIGAHALAAHGIPRVTSDMDFWISPTPENARAVYRALDQFDAPVAGLFPEDFEEAGIVYQIGLPPFRIDVVTPVAGLDFDGPSSRAVKVNYAGFTVRVPCLDDLITIKKATGRLKDLADAEVLEARAQAIVGLSERAHNS